MSAIRIILPTLILFIFALYTPIKTQAKIELKFSAVPAEIQMNQTIQVDVSISGADQNAEYYIRGVFYKPETTQYFGYTQNNQQEWNKDSTNFTQFFKIIGNTTETIQFKPDVESSAFTPNSGYLFKIGRYTPGGSVTWTEQTPSTIYLHSTPPEIPVTGTPIPTEVPPTTMTITPHISVTVTPTPSTSTSLTPIPTISLTTTPIIIDPTSIILSEIMACPHSGEDEWIEIKNQTASVISLMDWKLRDSTETHSLTIKETISSYGYLIIPITSSLFNNSGDTVRLFTDTGALVDQMSYTTCVSGTTFISVNDLWQLTKNPTKGGPNDFQALITPSPSVIPTKTLPPSSEKESDDEINESQDTSEQIISASFSLPEPLSLNTLIKATHLESTLSDNSVATISTTVSPSIPIHKTTQSAALLFGGCSYIITAALMAQKWYTIAT